MNANTRLYRLLAFGALLAACAVCVGFIATLGAGYFLIQATLEEMTTPAVVTATPSAVAQVLKEMPTSMPTAVVPSLQPPTPSPAPAQTPIATVNNLQPPPIIDQRPLPPNAYSSLEALSTLYYPPRDYYQDQIRLGHEKPRPRTVTFPAYAVGDQESFRVEAEILTATLAYRTDKLYFWFAPQVAYDPQLLTSAAARIQNELYPAVTSLFGEEWNPGIDNDPRIHILHLEMIETEELGYFTSGDEYPQTTFSHSNEREIIYVNMDLLELDDELYFGTVVHELEHLIQWHVDSNETTWLDEGLAQLGEVYAGLNTVVVNDYLQQPNLQFNSWSYDDEISFAHYSAAALFVIYFWEQLGDAAVRDLAAHPANGLASVEAVLQNYRPQSSLEDFVSDWYVANLLHNDQISPTYDYRFAFGLPEHDFRIDILPYEESDSLVPYGVRYIELAQPGTYTLSFAADTAVDLLNTNPHSGTTVWFAPGFNNVNSSLQRTFDLTAVKTATLEFWVWYELEEDYDFGYVLVSTDAGTMWQQLPLADVRHGYYGPAFSGRSATTAASENGWLFQTVDLSPYTDRQVTIAFEILTDSGVPSVGLALDDIAIPEIGYYSDVEGDTADWQAAGFAPVSTMLPQQWSVQLIHYGANARVEKLQLDSQNQSILHVDVEEAATLVVAPITPFTNEEVYYWFRLE